MNDQERLRTKQQKIRQFLINYSTNHANLVPIPESTLSFLQRLTEVNSLKDSKNSLEDSIEFLSNHPTNLANSVPLSECTLSILQKLTEVDSPEDFKKFVNLIGYEQGILKGIYGLELYL